MLGWWYLNPCLETKYKLTERKERGDRPMHLVEQGSRGGEGGRVAYTCSSGLRGTPPSSSHTEHFSSSKTQHLGECRQRGTFMPLRLLSRCDVHPGCFLPSCWPPTSYHHTACPNFTHSTPGKFPISLGTPF